MYLFYCFIAAWREHAEFHDRDWLKLFRVQGHWSFFFWYSDYNFHWLQISYWNLSSGDGWHIIMRVVWDFFESTLQIWVWSKYLTTGTLLICALPIIMLYTPFKWLIDTISCCGLYKCIILEMNEFVIIFVHSSTTTGKKNICNI